MTPDELITFGESRYGKKGWIGKLAAEIGFSHSQVWRVARRDEQISRRMELEIKNLEPNKKSRG